MHWYIDALDARSGRAFATFREPGLFSATTLDGGKATYFIEPPSFDPTLANRSVAFAATRAQFQEGFLDEEGEIPFDDLASVVEFVRRSYLRRGGGGSGGEGGAPPDRPPGDTPPPWPEMASEEREGEIRGRDPVDDLSRDTLHFVAITRKLDRGAAKEVDPWDQARPVQGGSAAIERLARGALRVALEQVGSYAPAGDPRAVAAQASTLARLCDVIIGAGLSEALTRIASEIPGLDRWFEAQLVRIGVSSPGEPAAEMLLPFLAASGDPNSFPFWDWKYRRRYFWPGWGIAARYEDDPVDLLERLFLPSDLVAQYAPAPGKDARVDQLLFSLLAAPQLSSLPRQAPNFPRESIAFEIALFASACIILPSLWRRTLSDWRFDAANPRDATIVATEAERWLRANLPSRAFSSSIENLIVDVRSLASVTGSLTGPEPAGL